ncbi:MAG: type III polyketide synthase [Planctomycetia bacterium]
MSLTLLGLGTAAPPRSIAQGDAARLAAGFNNAAPGRERTLSAIYRHTRIESRGSVLLEEHAREPFAQSFYPPACDADDAGPTTAARMTRYREASAPLEIAAARSAVDAAAVASAAITHLVTCSCTGFANPGLDLDVVAAVRLPAGVQRTHVGFMGCHGAFNALRVADAFATADPRAVALVVCVELCSLHFQYGHRPDSVVANSIFADGAGAVVGVGPGHARAAEPGKWRIIGQASQILPESADQMAWLIGDHGFEMSLAAQVPDTIRRHIGPVVDDGLARLGHTRADVRSWAVHPGGPRVLAGVAEALALAPESLAASHQVLAAHGNMSSATILFILQRLLAAGAPTPCVALAFGPGLTAEMAVVA